jgi:hypothetical protein
MASQESELQRQGMFSLIIQVENALRMIVVLVPWMLPPG